MPISRKGKFWGIGICLLLFVMMAFAQIKRWPEEWGDSTYFAEMLDNIRHCGKPLTHVNASMVVALQAMYSKPEVTCAMPLGYLPIINEFSLHVYLIIYAIAPFSYVVPSPILVPGLMTACFMGLLILVYVSARRLGIPPLWGVAFCALVSLHPAWKISIFGQSYVDRIFLLTGFAYLLALSAERPRMHWIALAGAACTAVNDRTGLLCAIITFGYLILFPKRLEGLRIPIALMGVCFAALSYYFFHYYIFNLAPTFFPPLRHAFDFTDIQKKDLVLLGAVSFPLLLLAACDWRALLLVGAMMIPNVFGNVGGAEKTGWETHYHSYYFPVLAWAALRGFSNLYAGAKARIAGARRRAALFAFAGGALIAYSLTILPHELAIHFASGEIAQNPWTRSFSICREYMRPRDQRPKNVFEEINRVIPAGAPVSMIETGMPTLYPGRMLYLLPAGIDYTGYLVLAVKERVGSHYVYCDISPYTDPVTRDKLNDCLYGRMRKGGFDLDHPTIFAPGYAIVKRRLGVMPAGD